MTNRLALGCLNRVKHGVAESDLLEHATRDRLAYQRGGSFPEEPTVRREDSKGMGDILELVLFILASAHRVRKRNAFI